MTSPRGRLEPRLTLGYHRIEEGPDTPRSAGLKREPRWATTSPDVVPDLPGPASTCPIRTSRCIRSSITSRRSRSSSARSSGSRERSFFRARRSWAHQFPSVPSLMPRSRATCAIGLPGSTTSCTAPCLKSSSNFRYFLAIAPLPPQRRRLHVTRGSQRVPAGASKWCAHGTPGRLVDQTSGAGSTKAPTAACWGSLCHGVGVSRRTWIWRLWRVVQATAACPRSPRPAAKYPCGGLSVGVILTGLIQSRPAGWYLAHSCSPRPFARHTTSASPRRLTTSCTSCVKSPDRCSFEPSAATTQGVTYWPSALLHRTIRSAPRHQAVSARPSASMSRVRGPKGRTPGRRTGAAQVPVDDIRDVYCSSTSSRLVDLYATTAAPPAPRVIWCW